MKTLSTAQRLLTTFLLSGILPVWYIHHAKQLTAGVGDAQGGIVILSAVFWAVIIWSVLGFSIYKFIAKLQNADIKGSLTFIGLTFIAAGFNGYLLKTSFEQEYVLTAAQDPNTSPTELDTFVGYKTNFGYHVDNLVASNPSSSAATLERLYAKKDQVGTLMSLARNPSTPNWILEELASSHRTKSQASASQSVGYQDRRHQEMILKSLKTNPKVQSGEIKLEEVIDATATN